LGSVLVVKRYSVFVVVLTENGFLSKRRLNVSNQFKRSVVRWGHGNVLSMQHARRRRRVIVIGVIVLPTRYHSHASRTIRIADILRLCPASSRWSRKPTFRYVGSARVENISRHTYDRRDEWIYRENRSFVVTPCRGHGTCDGFETSAYKLVTRIRPTK